MPITQIEISAFLTASRNQPVFDVRSPAEFARGHIPGAISLPLFSDEERKVVGTAYKKVSRQEAVKKGLDFFSERMLQIPPEVEAHLNLHKLPPRDIKIFVHCWRGGMRSGAVAWLLSLYGYQVFTLKGGYKTFRKWVLAGFENQYRFKVLGGFTGSGKTELLTNLANHGCNVIDLEEIASHRGSAFGGLGNKKQPTQEMFENKLAYRIHELLAGEDPNSTFFNPFIKEIWVEDESRHIGRVGIPLTFWNNMRKSPLYFLEIPFEERLKYVIEHYAKFPQEELVEAILKIQKRLGGLATREAVNFIKEGDVKSCFRILLRYYDRLYKHSLEKREQLALILNKIHMPRVSTDVVAALLPGEFSIGRESLVP